jgi:colanic acid/amylovoran biosynthesis glycosyltransferase
MYGYLPNNGYYDLLFQNANLITTNTAYLHEELVKLGCPKNKIQIIPVGVDCEYFNDFKKSHHEDQPLKLVNVGRLDPIKGQKYLIEIVAKLKQVGVDVNLNIVGDGTEKENLLQLIQHMKVEEQVFLLGKKSQSEIKEILLASDLYVFTAVPLADGRRETQGLATLEAQACGLPILAFNSGGIKYTFENEKTGFLFDEFDIKGMTEKIKYLDKNRTIIKEMSKKSYYFVYNNFNQKMIDKKWEINYQKPLCN